MDIPEQGEFCIIGTVKTSNPEAFANGIAELMEKAKTEEGIKYYCISRNPKDPSIMHIFERYENKAAFERHMATDWVKAFMALDIVTDTKIDFCRPAQKASL